MKINYKINKEAVTSLFKVGDRVILSIDCIINTPWEKTFNVPLQKILEQIGSKGLRFGKVYNIIQILDPSEKGINTYKGKWVTVTGIIQKIPQTFFKLNTNESKV